MRISRRIRAVERRWCLMCYLLRAWPVEITSLTYYFEFHKWSRATQAPRPSHRSTSTSRRRQSSTEIWIDFVIPSLFESGSRVDWATSAYFLPRCLAMNIGLTLFKRDTKSQVTQRTAHILQKRTSQASNLSS